MEIGIEKTEKVNFEPPVESNPEILAAMSMAVIKIEDYYQALLRQVQKSNQEEIPESVLAFVSSKNGVDFERSGITALKPNKTEESPDSLAVEDPTIVKIENNFYVFHSAVQKNKERGSGVIVSIQVAKGENLQAIGEKKLILTPQEIRNTLGEKADMVKEPEFFLGPDGLWYMIFEHTGRGKSEIAIAEAPNILGPYRNFRPLIETRENKFDSQHTSPGPFLITSSGDILMFYNGRGPRNSLDQTPTWAIGWAIIDTKRWNVVQRAENPIIIPPEEIGPGNQLIAFSNSIVPSTREHKLYYTVADKRSVVASIKVNNL